MGWILSASLHLGVAAIAFVGLPELTRDRPEPPPPIAIEFVAIAEKTQVVAPEAPQQQERAEVEPQANYAAAEAAEEAPADAAPLLEKPTEVKPVPKPKPKPQVSKNRQLANRITPRTKPKPPSRLKSKRIAALIDRSIKEEREQTPRDEEKKQDADKAKEPEPRPDFLQGARARIATASLMDALRHKVEQNWSFPGGAKGIETMQVTIRIWIRPDGYFSRAPEFLDAGDLSDPDRAFFRIFAESARRAVMLSEPFDDAAKHMDASQKYIDFNFNGAEFAGG